MPTAAQPDLKTFLKEVKAAFKPLGLTLSLAVPYDDNDWNYKAYAALTDYLILMAYDEHWAEGEAGPIASQDWFEKTLDQRMQELDPTHTIIAIGGYGYDWVKGKIAEDLTFQEALQAARDSETDVTFDPDSENPHFSYVEDDGKTHNIWFLDGVTAYNEIHAADIYQPAGYAVWRLGSEDPSLWSAMGRPYGATAPDALKTINASDDIDFEGHGEILRVASRPGPGTRSIEIDPRYRRHRRPDLHAAADLLLSSTASAMCQARWPSPSTTAPTPEWTPKILDVLKQKQAVGTFFMIGENAAANPDLVRRVVDEGNEGGQP